MKTNIILIGMAGCGKSTLGVLLAKALGFEFIDTDLIIQKNENSLLQDIINSNGIEYFNQVEQQAICSLSVDNAVIATGGSAVYSALAMEHLKENGVCVWLKLPYDEVVKRINNIATRGIVIAPGKSLFDVFTEREPLYRQYADIVIDCMNDIETNISSVISAYREYLP